MWPFKKRIRAKKNEVLDFESVLCIPGKWTTRKEFILEIAKVTDGEYIAAGNVLFHHKSNRGFEINFCGYVENMRMAFEYAGRVNRVSDSFVQTIAEHHYIIYLIEKGGSLVDAEQIARAGNAILKAVV